MKRLGIIVGVLFLLVIGGGLTSRMETEGRAGFLPATIRQADSPEASVFDAASWQADQFLLMVGFVVFNVVGMGVTIALVMWFMHRQVRIVEQIETGDSSVAESNAASL